jgi:two-component system sensor kinase
MEALAGRVFAELAGREPGRTLRLSLEPLPPACGDPAMLRQVWTNLLANAVKYTSTREVAQINIGSRTGGREITYFVQDNGVGFDMQYVGQLFGVFRRLHNGAEFEGTGVGLALTQRILRRHGGRVWADAAVDAGATFFFTLPCDGRV